MRESESTKRERAVRRGLEFVYRLACDPDHFAEHGSDLLNCFYFISATSEDDALRRAARKMGRERAREWRRMNRSLPRGADAGTITWFVHGSYAAERLGERDDKLKEQLRRAVPRFGASDYLWFDPAVEPPPCDVPETCDCGAENPRGRKKCRRCRAPLTAMSRYWVYVDALTMSYTGERFGVRVGGSYESVIKWLPHLRPYNVPAGEEDEEFYEKIYAITHVVYTLNDYSRYRLSPRWLPEEYEYLKAGLARAIETDDPEMLGEIMDSLRAFGLAGRHPLMREGTRYLTGTQNADGSWGDTETEDIYHRYHSTWTAVDGLREYRWRGERLSFPELRPLLGSAGRGVESGRF